MRTGIRICKKPQKAETAQVKLFHVLITAWNERQGKTTSSRQLHAGTLGHVLYAVRKRKRPPVSPDMHYGGDEETST